MINLLLIRRARPSTRALLIAIFALSAGVLVSAQADNRYCAPANHARFGDHDGPAASPQSCFYTALAATPSPGKTIRLAAPSDLQSAINHAQCGDTLELAAGTRFEGNFIFPPKRCDDLHWITITTGGQLPPEGTRISPCFAGMSSLPGRPSFPCTSPSKVMATLVVPPSGTLKVSDHYRFIGLELTRSPGAVINALVSAQNSSKLVFDRVWLHGNGSDETTRGIAFPGASFLAVIDSYFSDFHCTALTGACTDAQALWAGTGDVAGGTYKIVDNFLEASGENILMGGGGGSATPADLEIRRNYFFKPLTWHVAEGPRFIVKNNFELKNGERVLLEGNLFENSWGGFSQAGYQLLLTPKSQSNACPLCIVRDVTIRYCVFRHSGAGMQLASEASDSGGLSRGLFNVSIHDVIIQDVNGRSYSGNGATFQISASAQSVLHDISIRHITLPASDRLFMFVGGNPGAAHGMEITDSILGSGQYQVMSTGGHWNCAFQRNSPKDIFDSCWPGYNISGNVIVGVFNNWPSGNRSVKDAKSLGFSNNEEYQALKLPSHSEFRGKANDGKDPGADVERIQSFLPGQ